MVTLEWRLQLAPAVCKHCGIRPPRTGRRAEMCVVAPGHQWVQHRGARIEMVVSHSVIELDGEWM